MSTTISTTRPVIVRLADRTLGLLQRLYPRRFYRQYAVEIARASSMLTQSTYELKGARGVLGLMTRSVLDTLRTALREHRLNFQDPSRKRQQHGSRGPGSNEIGASLMQDLRYAVRTLVRNPGFTAAAVITMALGIGANTAIFSVVDAVIFQPLPYTDGSRLVQLHQQGLPNGNTTFSPLEILDYREQSETLEQVVEYHSLNFNLLGRGEPERVRSGVVSWNFFQTLGLRPLLGRAFVPEDDLHGAEPVLVLSHRYWQSSFGGDSSVVGQTVEMNDHIHTIVGVLPPVPHYPRENEVYMPTVACPFRSADSWADNRSARGILAFGRVRPGVDAAQVDAELGRLSQNIHDSHPEHYTNFTGHAVNTRPLKDQLTSAARPTLFILMGTVGLLLLIACANVANLMLSHLFRREREMALRSALGAGRGRLARQLVTESTLLTVAGGALGLAFAIGGLDLLITFTERFTTRAREIDIDGSVLLFTLVISVGTGLLFGLLPALPARHDLGEALKDGSRATANAGRLRLRGALVVSQLAVSFMVLIGAGLVVRSLWRLQHVDAGFEAHNVLTMTLAVPFNFDPSRHLTYKDGILERVRALPGVSTAALSSTFPLGAAPVNRTFDVVGRRTAEGRQQPTADMRFVTSEYFATINHPVIRGRTFERGDRVERPLVAVVNQTLARNHFADEDPIGQLLLVPSFFGEQAVTIVGIVGDVRKALDAEIEGEVYLSFLQIPFSFARIVVATTGNPMDLVRPVTDAVHVVAEEVPVIDVQTLADVRRESLASPRLTALLLATFGGLALIITAMGVAAVIGFSVSQRSHEIGVRMALGARRDSVLGMILWQGMRLVLIGLAIGIVGAVALARVMSGLLFDIAATDAVTFVSVAVMLAGVAVLATLVPARRATTVDPMIALRSE
ncbi:MAG: ABC transporter permease [Gemmatimonadetes bacterium]|nr:ABC transporter permease [Gemmatimonadota bacterium]